MTAVDAHSLVDLVSDPAALLALPEAPAELWVNTSRLTLAQLQLYRRDAHSYRRQLRELCASVPLPPKSASYRGHRLQGFAVPAAVRKHRAPRGWRIDDSSHLLVPYRRTVQEKTSGPGLLFSSVEFRPRLATYVDGLPAAFCSARAAWSGVFDAGAALLVWADENGDTTSPKPASDHGFESISPAVWAAARTFAAEDLALS